MTHIWVGPKSPPTKWMNTWKDRHPGWDYRVITDKDFWQTPWRLRRHMNEYYRRRIFNGVADIIRYEILHKDGGFVPPADAVCLNNIDELLTAPEDYCYTVYENEDIRPEYVSPILAASPGNNFIETVIREIERKPYRNLVSAVWKETGNLFMAKMIARENPKIHIWPSHYMIPQHYSSNTIYNGPDKIYANQMWGTTKGLYE